jgi:hypothetical protein
VDYRLAGRLSRLIRNGFAAGEPGEVLLVPGKPRLPFDKILLFGLGAPERFDEGTFRATVERILSTLEGLRARTALVELPGRHFGGIAPERATELLLESVGGRREHDLWTLVEPAEAQRAISQHLVQRRTHGR